MIKPVTRNLSWERLGQGSDGKMHVIPKYYGVTNERMDIRAQQDVKYCDHDS